MGQPVRNIRIVTKLVNVNIIFKMTSHIPTPSEKQQLVPQEEAGRECDLILTKKMVPIKWDLLNFISPNSDLHETYTIYTHNMTASCTISGQNDKGQGHTVILVFFVAAPWPHAYLKDVPHIWFKYIPWGDAVSRTISRSKG